MKTFMYILAGTALFCIAGLVGFVMYYEKKYKKKVMEPAMKGRWAKKDSPIEEPVNTQPADPEIQPVTN